MRERLETEPDTANLGRTAAVGFGWFVGGRIFNVIVNLGVTAIIARILTPADFGMYGVVLVVLGFAQTLNDGALCLPLVQRKTVEPEYVTASLLGSFLVALVAVGLILALSGTIERLMGFEGLAVYLSVASLTLLPSTLSAVFIYMMQRLHAFKALNIAASLAYAFGFATVAVTLAVLGYGVWALVWGRLASCVLELVVLAALRRFPVPLKWPGFVRLREVLGLGSLVSVTMLVAWATLYTPSTIIGRMLGAEQLGYFIRASNVMHLAIRVTAGSFIKVLIPAAARMEGDASRERTALLKTLYYMLVPQTVIAALVIMNAELIVSVLYGPQWVASIGILKWLFAAYLPLSGVVLLENFALGIGRTKETLVRRILTFFMLAAGIGLGAMGGIAGAAQGFFAAFMFVFVLSAFYVFGYMRIPAIAFVMLLARIGGLVALPAIAMSLAAAQVAHGIAAGLAASVLFSGVSAALLVTGGPALLGDILVRGRGEVFARWPFSKLLQTRS